MILALLMITIKPILLELHCNQMLAALVNYEHYWFIEFIKLSLLLIFVHLRKIEFIILFGSYSYGIVSSVSTPGPTRACALVNLTCALVNS